VGKILVDLLLPSSRQKQLANCH